ncbi:MAG: hypothetical protein FWC50_15950, partial [Planctomycetaceae bacterium]|nr:hypothetical protein [Planctomycetaceae bacterium]
SRLKIPEAGHGKSCNAGRLRKAEGCRPYRLRYTTQWIHHTNLYKIICFYPQILQMNTDFIFLKIICENLCHLWTKNQKKERRS